MHKALSLSLALIALAGCPKDQGTDTGTGGALPPASLTVSLRAAPGAAVDVALTDLAVVRVGGDALVLEAGPIAAHLPADGAAVTLLTADVDADEIEAITFTVDGDPVEVAVAPDGARISLTVDGATRTFRAE
jgi:hypothetical protein